MKYILALLFILIFSISASAQNSSFSFTRVSITPGSKQEFKEYSGDNVIFLGGSFNHSGFYMRIVKGNEDWSVSAINADFKEMRTGEYLGARRFVMDGHPALDFSGCGHGYNESSGSFKILEITWGPNQTIKSLAVDFTFYGESLHIDMHVGSLRYNSLIPPSDCGIHKPKK